MPNMMSWFQLRGRKVTVTDGPLKGLSGALQDVSGDHATVGYRDGHGYFSTFEVQTKDLKPELKEGEELSA